MKNLLYVLIIAIAASACSGPKYTASFNSWDKRVNYQVAATPETTVIAEPVIEPVTTAQPSAEPLTTSQPEQLLASTSNSPVDIKSSPKEAVRKTYIQMTRTERKELRTHLRSEIKTYVMEQKKNMGIESGKATSAWDHDLKMAAIFGAIGLALGLFFGVNEIIGFIGFVAIIIALVFLVKWLVRQ